MRGRSRFSDGAISERAVLRSRWLDIGGEGEIRGVVEGCVRCGVHGRFRQAQLNLSHGEAKK
jgi:hypothetical protein